ncbi:MAG: histidinol-phosphatase [Treponema sp.]|nr:histidinol-phosphatase [Treponema sp.]
MKIPKGLSSLHTHTLFCDGADDVETMCLAAFEKGLRAIGFSAHAPIFRATGIRTEWHLPDERLEEYISEVQSARDRWQGKLEVYLGLELDYIRGLRSALDRDIRALELDYIIGSVHYVVPPTGQPFTVDGTLEEIECGIREGFGGDGEALMHTYWDAVAEMIALGGFDILGHADIIKKKNHDNRWFNMKSEACQQRMAEIAAALGRSGLAAEINTGGLNRKRINETFPSLAFVKLFRENQVPLLISSDAHCAKDVDGHYETAWETLRAAGYTDQEIVCQNDTVLGRFSHIRPE